jgi:hypothetical protein
LTAMRSPGTPEPRPLTAVGARLRRSSSRGSDHGARVHDPAGLRGLATLPPWLVAVLEPDRLRASLTHALHEHGGGDLVVHRCRPRHFRLEGDRWAFVCAVTVGGAGAADERTKVLLEGWLGPPGAAAPGADGRTVAFGSEGWRCRLPDLGAELRTAPPDTALPLVADLTEADRARVLLEDAIRRGSPAHADLRLVVCRPRVMRYDRGNRCTVLCEVEHAAADGGRDRPGLLIAKTHRDDRGRNAYDAMRALWSSELRRSPAVAIAEPLAYRPEVRLLVQGPVAGDRSLSDLIVAWSRQRTPAAVDELEAYTIRAAEGLAALHGCGVSWGESVTLQGEVAHAQALIAQLAVPIPELSGIAAPLLDRVVDLAAEHPADAARPSHGTFRPAQVLLHRGGVGFIDFDDFCQAEPALDVARFRAGIRDIGMRDLVGKGDGITPDSAATRATTTALEALCEVFLRRYEALAPVSRERIVLWETLDLLTYVLHAWDKLSPARLRARTLTLEEHLRSSALMTGSRPAAAPAHVDDPGFMVA